MTIFEAVILAFAQGITEFLPVSSSGHLVLLQDLFGITTEQLTFTLVVHIASALAILLFFVKRISVLTKTHWFSILVGTLPVVVIGLLFKDVIENAFSNVLLVSVALFVTGLLNLGTHFMLKKRDVMKSQQADIKPQSSTVSWKQALLIGTVQACAITPGISRSGSTVFAGLIAGLDRKTAFDISFMLALPAIGGATVLQLLEMSGSFESEIVQVFMFTNVLGFVVALLVSYASLNLLRYMIEKAEFWWFSVYCFAIAGLTLFL